VKRIATKENMTTATPEKTLSKREIAKRLRNAPIFDTVYAEDAILIRHVEKNETLIQFPVEAAEQAEETANWANKLAKFSATKLANEIESIEAGTKRDTAQKIFDLCDKVVVATAVSPAEKSRDSYGSAARQSFQPNNVTDKERAVLEALETLAADGKQATIAEVSELTGISVNAISGGISVMLAKGFVGSRREKVGPKLKRVLYVAFPGWRDIEPPAPKIRKAKADTETVSTVEDLGDSDDE
jgi:hypothetical protein